jgi:hypothetical protein
VQLQSSAFVVIHESDVPHAAFNDCNVRLKSVETKLCKKTLHERQAATARVELGQKAAAFGTISNNSINKTTMSGCIHGRNTFTVATRTDQGITVPRDRGSAARPGPGWRVNRDGSNAFSGIIPKG